MRYKLSNTQYLLITEQSDVDTYRKWINVYLDSKKWTKYRSYQDNLLRVGQVDKDETMFEAYDQWQQDDSVVRILAIKESIYSFIRQVLRVPHMYIEHLVLEWFNKKFKEKCVVTETF